jgi:hypothetical protein
LPQLVSSLFRGDCLSLPLLGNKSLFCLGGACSIRNDPLLVGKLLSDDSCLPLLFG